MREIEKIIDQIHDEIEGAEEYYKCAKEFKEKNITIANTYLELAQVELTHVDKLHSIAVTLINKEKELKKPIPTGMVEIWDWLHKKIVGEVEELKFKIAKFKS